MARFCASGGCTVLDLAIVPDGRVWPEGVGMERPERVLDVDSEEAREEREAVGYGRGLLQHAKRTEEGRYVVEADRRRPGSN